MLNKAEMSEEKAERRAWEQMKEGEKKLKLYNTSNDEPWMHSAELTSALHLLSGPTLLRPTSHTKPSSTLYWQAIQWAKRCIDVLWLAAFCSLSISQ